MNPTTIGLDRRNLLKALGTGLVVTAAACAPVPKAPTGYRRRHSRRPFAAPRVSKDAVIRVVVGHRPYRPPGFRVEKELLGDKTLVHNYGHGGGGLSLGWGSSALAVREVVGMRPGTAAVIGSGIMGLCSARLLQDAGWSVTIYTRDTYRHTTSNVAAGEWGPYATHDSSVADDVFMAKLDWAARISHHAYTNLTGPKYGIRWLEGYELRSSRPGEGPDSSFQELFSYPAILGPGEHPFGDRWAKSFVTMQIDPGTLLRQLTSDFQQAGGRVVIRSFADSDDVLSVPEAVIFNCTGLGAAALFDDQDLVPAKGQLVFLPPDPAVDYMTFGGGAGNLYMFPRSDVLLLGGTFKLDDYSRNPEPDETERIVAEHRKLFEGFG
jgi:glycine/D-amino acid oxidase-like deaminating enzyme